MRSDSALIQMPLSSLSAEELQQRKGIRQRQLAEYSHSQLIMEIVEDDLQSIAAELKKRPKKARQRSKLKLISSAN